MSSRGFAQLIKISTTDSGSLLDHIYFNGNAADAFVDVIDTYYSDHDATYLSVSNPDSRIPNPDPRTPAINNSCNNKVKDV